VLDARIRGAAASTKKALDEIKSLFAGVPKESIGLVFSAAHSLEDNYALHELGTVLFGSSLAYTTGMAAGYEDEILIHRDKNPNTTGVVQLAPGAKTFQTLLDDVAAGRVTHVLALGGAAPSAADALRGCKLVTVAAHEGPLVAAAAVVLPATSWAEQSGTYVNAKGVRQISERALEPQGASKPAWRQLADLATALGYKAPSTKLKQIRTQLMGSAADAGQSAGGAPAE
jgi:NADH dehydrogenase/NADH:ubiquinone oxidoreductase subunit G